MSRITYSDVFLTQEGLARQGDIVFDGIPNNRLRERLVFGKGKNDFKSAVQKQCNNRKENWILYNMWKNMLKRAYYPKYHAIKPTYLDVEVSPVWFSFNKFLEWVLPQDYHGDHIQLDKELIGRGKYYGPDDCILVPRSANMFINTLKGSHDPANTGAYTVGNGKFTSGIYDEGKFNHLGRFQSEESAHNAWIYAKKKIAEKHKPEWDSVDARIHPLAVEFLFKTHVIKQEDSDEAI